MLEAKRIVWPHGDLASGPVAGEIVIDVSDMMVDDHDRSPGLVYVEGYPGEASLFEKST
jgi:hypothetical protein